MSAISPTGSPVHVEPLHNPTQAAHVVVPQAPLGNATKLNMAPGMGARALLAKKMAKSSNPTFISPTDNLMTPCTQKISAAKKKHFNKAPKPVQGGLFAHKDVSDEESSPSEEEHAQPSALPEKDEMKVDDEENPF